MNLLKYFFCYRYSIVDLFFISIAFNFIRDGAWIIGFVVLAFGFICTSLVKIEFVDKDEA